MQQFLSMLQKINTNKQYQQLWLQFFFSRLLGFTLSLNYSMSAGLSKQKQNLLAVKTIFGLEKIYSPTQYNRLTPESLDRGTVLIRTQSLCHKRTVSEITFTKVFKNTWHLSCCINITYQTCVMLLFHYSIFYTMILKWLLLSVLFFQLSEIYSIYWFITNIFF